MHSGQFLATSSLCMPIRSSAAGSTSTPSFGSGEELDDKVFHVLKELKSLAFDGWQPVAVKRLQERLGWADLLYVHGFVIVEFKNVEEGHECQAFVRLDWGHDGLGIQINKETDNKFTEYCGITNPAPQQVACGATGAGCGVAIGVAASTSAVAATEAAAGAAVATEAVGVIAAVCSNPVTATVGAVALVGLAAATVNYACTATPVYVPVQGTTKALIKAIEAKKDEKYDLALWNCNHFADYVVKELGTDSSAK